MTVSEKQWKELDKAYHEQDAVVESYDRRITAKYRYEHRFLNLDVWVAQIGRTNPRRVLDFGCGTGLATLKLAQAGIPAVSADLSEKMVRYVKTKTAAAGCGCMGVVCDVEKLPFKPGSFDALICSGVLHHLPDIPCAVTNQIACVRPGGRMYITEPFFHHSWVSAPYNLLVGLAKGARSLLRRDTSATLHERPLRHSDVAAILRLYEASGVQATVRYIIFWPLLLSLLPQWLAAPCVRLLNALNAGMRRGDSVNIVATRTGDPGTDSGRP